MLTKLVLFHAALFQKAVIQFDRPSIQFIGNNNTGKSAILQALNFLLIPDLHQDHFGGNRDISSILQFYFPQPNQSLILFELKKNLHYQCILVKREKDNSLSYYLLKEEYKEAHFFKEEEGVISQRSFKELLRFFEKEDIECIPITDKQNIPLLQYTGSLTSGKQNTLLEKKQTLLFSKLYPYLLHPCKVNYEVFKSALIQADGKEDLKINFIEKSRVEYRELQRLKHQIRLYQIHLDLFESFERVFAEFDRLHRCVKKLYGDFLEKQSLELYEIEVSMGRKIKEISTIQNETNLLHKPNEAKLLKEIGVLEYLLSQKNKDLKSQEDNELSFALKEESKTIRNHLALKEEELDHTRKLLGDKSYQVMGLSKQKESLEKQRQEIQKIMEELQNLGIEPLEEEKPIEKAAIDIYKELKAQLQVLKEKEVLKNQLFNELKGYIEKDFQDEASLINYYKNEIYAYPQKRERVQEVLESIANYFVLPARKMLDKLEEFKKTIKKINRFFDQYKLSSIQKIRIELVEHPEVINELEQMIGIKKIDSEQLSLNFGGVFTSHNNRPFELLSEYLEKNSSMEFSHLFDLRIIAFTHQKKQVIDLNTFIESEGTDQMLRLYLMLTTMKWIQRNNPNGGAVFYMDETYPLDVQNLEEIKNFCKDHHWLSIFASHQFIQGFTAEKYYFLKPSITTLNEDDALYNNER